MKKIKNVHKNKKKILEQIKFLRSAIQTLDYAIDEFEEIVGDMPNRQLDIDLDEDCVIDFENKLAELGDESSCIESYLRKVSQLFYGK